MLVSSPSSAAPNRFPSSRRQLPSYSVSHSPTSAAPPAPTAVSNSCDASLHRSSPSSRALLSPTVEEIRAALRKHTVDAPSHSSAAEPSRVPSRGSMSSGPETLGGETRQSNITNSSSIVASQPSENSAAANVQAAVPSASPASTKRQLADAAADEQPSTQPASQSAAELEQNRAKRVRPPAPDVKLLPREYEFADPNDMVILISSMIMELISYNDKIPLQGGKLTRFHSRSPPQISVRDYLQRLTTHATLSPPILLSMVYYIDRLCALYPAFTVSSLTVHRFLITSATVASKGLSDSFWTNKTYARVGGISLNELALLELEFLWRVEWKIVPQPEVLVDYYLSLVERCELYALEPEPQADTPATSVSIQSTHTL
jgi:hypothetical protein